jgi:TolA-binding protein
MNVRWLRLLGLLACLPFLQGCLWATWSEFRKEKSKRKVLEINLRGYAKRIRALEKVLQLQKAQLRALNAQNEILRSRQGKLQSQLKKGSSGVAELFETLQALERKFQTSLGTIAELQKQSKELAKKNPDLDKRYQELQKRYDELLRNQRKLADYAVPAKLYTRARKAYRNKERSKAEKLFRLFIKRFPTHDLADDAGIFLADLLKRRGKHTQAIIVYDDILKKHPNGSKIPLALFRLGELHYKKGMCRQGRRYFRRASRYRRRARGLARSAKVYYRNWRRLCRRGRRRR